MTRQMQKIHFATVLLYYSGLAFPVTAAFLFFEAQLNAHTMTIFGYDSFQYGWLFFIAFINYMGLNAVTIAMQNEKSGLITLLGYIGLVYCFLGDLFIFDEVPNWLEASGVLLILSMNVSLICQKM